MPPLLIRFQNAADANDIVSVCRDIIQENFDVYRSPEIRDALLSKRPIIEQEIAKTPRNEETIDKIINAIGYLILWFIPQHVEEPRRFEIGRKLFAVEPIADLLIKVIMPNAISQDSIYCVSRSVCRVGYSHDGAKFFGNQLAVDEITSLVRRAKDPKAVQFSLTIINNLTHDEADENLRKFFSTAENAALIFEALDNAVDSEVCEWTAGAMINITIYKGGRKHFSTPKAVDSFLNAMKTKATTSSCIDRVARAIINTTVEAPETKLLYHTQKAADVFIDAFGRLDDAEAVESMAMVINNLIRDCVSVRKYYRAPKAARNLIRCLQYATTPESQEWLIHSLFLLVFQFGRFNVIAAHENADDDDEVEDFLETDDDEKEDDADGSEKEKEKNKKSVKKSKNSTSPKTNNMFFDFDPFNASKALLEMCEKIRSVRAHELITHSVAAIINDNEDNLRLFIQTSSKTGTNISPHLQKILRVDNREDFMVELEGERPDEILTYNDLVQKHLNLRALLEKCEDLMLNSNDDNDDAEEKMEEEEMKETDKNNNNQKKEILVSDVDDDEEDDWEDFTDDDDDDDLINNPLRRIMSQQLHDHHDPDELLSYFASSWLPFATAFNTILTYREEFVDTLFLSLLNKSTTFATIGIVRLFHAWMKESAEDSKRYKFWTLITPPIVECLLEKLRIESSPNVYDEQGHHLLNFLPESLSMLFFVATADCRSRDTSHENIHSKEICEILRGSKAISAFRAASSKLDDQDDMLLKDELDKAFCAMDMTRNDELKKLFDEQQEQ